MNATHHTALDTARLRDFFIRTCATKQVNINNIHRLSGGAVQENWQIDVTLDGGPHAGQHAWVLRTDARATVQASLTRDREFTLLKFAHEQGLRAPQPLFLCSDADVIGRPFFVMEKLPGIAAGHQVVRMIRGRRTLAQALAQTLARIHAIRPPVATLDFLQTFRARDSIAAYRTYLDTLNEPHPALEWGLRWCERHAPVHEEITFIHRDFRTGNYLIDNDALSGLLDWEFAAWGNPLEDVGWICAKCWRFRHDQYVVGGVADLADFIPAYEAASGRTIDATALNYWQVMAHIRWAIIALQQAQRHLSGQEPSLELALTGRIVAELEWEILDLTEAA